MPKRQSTKKVISTELQGDDSFVVFASPTVHEMDTYRDAIMPLNNRIEALRNAGKTDSEEFAKLNKELEEMSRDLIPQYVKSWNWVDFDDKPLPQPSDPKFEMGMLTIHELQWLTSQFVLSVQEKKE